MEHIEKKVQQLKEKAKEKIKAGKKADFELKEIKRNQEQLLQNQKRITALQNQMNTAQNFINDSEFIQQMEDITKMNATLANNLKDDNKLDELKDRMDEIKDAKEELKDLMDDLVEDEEEEEDISELQDELMAEIMMEDKMKMDSSVNVKQDTKVTVDAKKNDAHKEQLHELL